jgi:hypothetical protein
MSQWMVGITVVAGVVIVGWMLQWVFPDIYMPAKYGFPSSRFKLRSKRPEPHPGCTDPLLCRGTEYRRHEPCVVCGGLTCRRSGWVDPDTLQRRVLPQCTLHSYGVRSSREQKLFREQYELQTQRRRNDLEKVTVPPDDSHLQYGRMPDQYPGPVRDAIRAFLLSDDSEVVVTGISAGSLNESLASTGQAGDMYAETRGTETVLRKV